MRFKKPIIAITAVGMLALAACGGSGSTNGGSGEGASGIDAETLAPRVQE